MRFKPNHPWILLLDQFQIREHIVPANIVYRYGILRRRISRHTMILVASLLLLLSSATITTVNSLLVRKDTATFWNRRHWLEQQGKHWYNVVFVASTFTATLQPSNAQVIDNDTLTLPSRWTSDTILKQTPPVAKSAPTTYPSWLVGTWNVTQTLVGFSAPLGARFLGGPNGDVTIGEASVRDVEKRIGEPVHLRLRYLNQLGNDNTSSSPTVVEDRIFNTQSRLDAFAGRRVVASAVPTKDTFGREGGAVLVQFRGPAAQKIFLTGSSAGRASNEGASTWWYGWEAQRALFALTNTNTAPPVSTDTELLFAYRQISEGLVEGRLRIASYLNPNDRLYFDAQRKAVSIQDYTLQLKRVAKEKEE